MVKPFMDFVAASLMKARFWVILCPLNFVGKLKDAVRDMAKGFAAQDVQDGISIWEVGSAGICHMIILFSPHA